MINLLKTNNRNNVHTISSSWLNNCYNTMETFLQNFRMLSLQNYQKIIRKSWRNVSSELHTLSFKSSPTHWYITCHERVKGHFITLSPADNILVCGWGFEHTKHNEETFLQDLLLLMNYWRIVSNLSLLLIIVWINKWLYGIFHPNTFKRFSF